MVCYDEQVWRLITIIFLWSWTNFVQAWPDPRPVPAEEQDPETEKDTGSSRKEPRVTSVKSSELQVHFSWRVAPVTSDSSL